MDEGGVFELWGVMFVGLSNEWMGGEYITCVAKRAVFRVEEKRSCCELDVKERGKERYRWRAYVMSRNEREEGEGLLV